MAIFRIEKNKDYTVMANIHLRDRNLTHKAKGLLSMMLSLPDDWDFSVNGLVAISKESKSAIQGELKELEDNGYLVRERERDEKGQFSYIYYIYEKPQTETPWTETPWTEKPFTDKPCTENRPQLNTNKQNTKELNTKELNTERDTVSLEQLYLDNCPRLKPYVPSSYGDELTKLHKAITNGYIQEDDIEKGFKMANESDFLSGKNDRGWKADFRWLIKPENLQKVLNGNYQNTKKQESIMKHEYDFDAIRRRSKDV